MSTKPLSLPDAAELRRRAEAELRALGADGKHRPMLAKISRNVATQLRQQKKKNLLTPAAATDPQRTLHELQVHQIELEMQNLELQEARDRMEAQLEKYTDLYDFAPVGYFSLDEQGVVLEANLTGAALLGMERSRLINRRLSRFVSPANQSDYLVFLKKIFTKSGNQDCDMAMVKASLGALSRHFRALPQRGQEMVPGFGFGHHAPQAGGGGHRPPRRHRQVVRGCHHQQKSGRADHHLESRSRATVWLSGGGGGRPAARHDF
jgi:PAS domain-containing protein